MRCRQPLPTRRVPSSRPPGPRVELVELTGLDGTAHLVPEQEVTARSAQDSGQFAAVCGHMVSPAPLVAPDGARCPGCAARRRSG